MRPGSHLHIPGIMGLATVVHNNEDVQFRV